MVAFMAVAIGAIGIGVTIMVGYIIIAQVQGSLPSSTIRNPCYGIQNDGSQYANCNSYAGGNTSEFITDPDVGTGIVSTKTLAGAGLALIAVGIIVLAAFGLIAVFR